MADISPAIRKPRDARVWLLLVLAVGLGLRLAHFVAIAGTPFPQFPRVFGQSDLNTFWEWAETIRAGDWLGRDTYHPAFDWMQAIAPTETWYRWWGGKAIFQQAPLYAYLVAGLLALSRGSLVLVSHAQLLMGALQPLVMFWLGRRLFDGRVGLVAAALTAVYGPFIFHESVLLRDWLPPILEPLALVALLRAREREGTVDWGLAGAVLGLAMLAKETILLFVPLALLWVVLGSRQPRGRAMASAVALLAGILLVLSPLIARNAVVGAPWLAFSNRTAEGFILGNAADGFPVGLTHPPSLRGILERSDGRLLAVVRETLGTYDGRWGELARLQGLKLRALGDPLEVPNNVTFYYAREISPVLRFTLTYGMIFPLGLAGFVLSLRVWRRHVLLILYALTTVAALMSTIILARFRLVLVPVLIIYAAAGLVAFGDAVRARRKSDGATYLALWAGVALTQHFVLPIPALREQHAIAIYRQEYLLAADIYARQGRPDRALAEIERLEARAAARPSFAELAREAALYDGDYRTQWALQLASDGRLAEARHQVERVDTTYQAYPELAYPLYNLAFLHLTLGDTVKARAYFERFLTREPTGARADRARRELAALAG